MRRYFAVLAILTMLVLIFRTDVAVSAGVVAILLGLYLLSLLLTRRAIDSLTVERSAPRRAFAGEQIQVRLAMRTTGRLPVPWIQFQEVVPEDMGAEAPIHVFHLPARGQRELRYRLQPEHRGLYDLGPARAEVSDALGFQTRSRVVREAERLVVYPRIYPLGRLEMPTSSPLATLPAPASLFEDTSRPIGAREYTPGDPLRRMDWLATARRGRPMVRQYQRAIARDTMICLDLDLAGYDPRYRGQCIEYAVSLAASLAAHVILEEHQAAGLITHAYDPLSGRGLAFAFRPDSGWGHLIAMLEVLARLQARRGQRSFVQAVMDSVSVIPFGSTVLVVAGQAGEDVPGMLTRIRSAGHAVAFILIDAPGAPPIDARLGDATLYRSTPQHPGLLQPVR